MVYLSSMVGWRTGCCGTLHGVTDEFALLAVRDLQAARGVMSHSFGGLLWVSCRPERSRSVGLGFWDTLK